MKQISTAQNVSYILRLQKTLMKACSVVVDGSMLTEFETHPRHVNVARELPKTPE